MAARDMLDRAMSEKDWQQLVVDVAVTYGWSAYHTFDSRKSQPGFPDLVLVHGDRLLFVELKREVGSETLAQQAWAKALDRVAAANVTVERHLWRPSDWPTVQRVLAP